MSAGKGLNQQEIKGLFERISNWGRWGKDDERGTLNYITDAKRLAAARAGISAPGAVHRSKRQRER